MHRNADLRQSGKEIFVRAIIAQRKDQRRLRFRDKPFYNLTLVDRSPLDFDDFVPRQNVHGKILRDIRQTSAQFLGPIFSEFRVDPSIMPGNRSEFVLDQ